MFIQKKEGRKIGRESIAETSIVRQTYKILEEGKRAWSPGPAG
jgi:hypothetical protein